MTQNISSRLAVAAFLLCLPVTVFGAGVVNNCTEADLRTALAGGGTVTFACDGVITLAGTLVITNNTVFDGAGRTVTLSGSNAVRVLQVETGVNFDLIGVTVANGRMNRGAGLYNSGITRVINCTFANNNAIEPTLGQAAVGGGIRNGGTLIAIGTTFIRNRAIGTNQSGGLGGAIDNSSTLLVTNCTFHGNQALGAFSGLGAAVFNEGMGPNGIVNCTFFGNHANGGAALQVSFGTVAVQNTIFATNTAGNVSGPTETAGGHNISSDSSGFWLGTGNQTSTDARLGVIGEYGGPTWTMPLLTGSPAIDSGDSTAAPSTDQRGRTRPYGAGIDIGAFESSPAYTIRGVVSGFTFYGEVPVLVGSNTAPTFNHGTFKMDGFNVGTYTVSPQNSDYLFLPASQSVSVGPDQINVNFGAYRWNTLSVQEITNNTVHLLFAGTNDVTRRLLVSTNLVQWQSIQTNTIGPELFWEIWHPVAGRRQQYFRTVSP